MNEPHASVLRPEVGADASANVMNEPHASVLRPEVGADASANVINQPHASVLRPEVGADASALLQRLCKHLVLADVVVSHRTTSKLHRFLEMSSRYFWHRVIVIILHARTQTHTHKTELYTTEQGGCYGS